MPSIVPSPYVVAHIKRVQSTELDPDTGDPVIIEAEPVIRRAQSLSQIGHRGSSKAIMGVDFLKRIETEIHLTVADPSEYGPLDQVRLFVEVDEDGCYVPNTGVAFWIIGLPNDARQSPWPQLTRIFGGILTLKRVT